MSAALAVGFTTLASVCLVGFHFALDETHPRFARTVTVACVAIYVLVLTR